jgi:hypothetical protein
MPAPVERNSRTTSVSRIRKSSVKTGYKRPPRKSASVTHRSIIDAIASLLRKGYVGEKLREFMRTDPGLFKAFVMMEVEVLKAARGQKLDQTKRSHRQWKRWVSGLSDWERCSMASEGWFWNPGAYRRRCRHCAKWFYCMRPHGRFCSPTCRSSARARRLLELRRWRRRSRCRKCNKRFIASRADARFCSARCRVQHFREQSRSKTKP